MITSSLKILLWDKEIGRLSWDIRRGVSYFEFNPVMLGGNLDPFPLVASTASPASRRPIMGDKETKLYRKLPPFLADSLPDAWGNQVFECWRIQNSIKNQEITPLEILSFIGKRGMGALEFIPESSGIKKSEQLNMKALTDLAQRIFTERENVKIMPDESLTMQSLIAVGTSAGGRQPKAIIAIHPETGEIRSGQIAGQKGFEYCILKFGDSERSSAELEMAYYKMAIAAGINMMPCRLIEVEGQTHFITHRFDRDGERKLHMQTLAALYPEADSYEKLLMVCRKMRLPESTQEEVFRRMVFNILANNTDDHNKNFSFLMDESGRWSLSPAYDMTYIFNVGGFLPEQMHCLMMQGKLQGQTKEDALALARDNGIRKAQAIIEEIAAAIRRFREFAEECGVKQRWIGPVETCLTEHLSAWGLQTKIPEQVSFTIGDTLYENVRVEQTYKGNYHLLCSVQGKERKFVITKSKREYAMIEQTGTNHLTQAQLYSLVETYLAQ
ncbi:MAG: type II toxin-antitoxin system HipA family toxin [Bacteroidales bacterium]|nr:type II toxin-antitoxin system HipA family toxin [Bacteroidales bacterium]